MLPTKTVVALPLTWQPSPWLSAIPSWQACRPGTDSGAVSDLASPSCAAAVFASPKGRTVAVQESSTASNNTTAIFDFRQDISMFTVGASVKYQIGVRNCLSAVAYRFLS